MGSSDLLSRYLHSRIEVCFPAYDKKLCEELNHILQLQLADTQKAVVVTDNLENKRIAVTGDETIAAQESIYNYVKNLGDPR